MTDSHDRYQKLYDEFKAHMLLATVAIVMVTTGLQAAVLTLLTGKVDWKILWSVYLTTAPLTTALALTAGGAWPNKEWRESFFSRLVESVAAAAFFLFLAALVSKYLGGLDVDWNQKLIPGDHGGPLGSFFVVNSIYAFFRAYGPTTFWSSVALGVCSGGFLRRL
jgi:hypothetical protein